MSLPVVATSFGVSQSGSQAGEKTDGYVQNEVEPDFNIRMRQNIDPAMDAKKLRRIISNSVSAHKSRRKKLRYVDVLVKKIRKLQRNRSEIRSRLEMVIKQMRNLINEQRRLNECISVRLQQCIESYGIIEKYKAEIERLKKIMAPPTNLT